jgi:hypothetical protein
MHTPGSQEDASSPSSSSRSAERADAPRRGINGTAPARCSQPQQGHAGELLREIEQGTGKWQGKRAGTGPLDRKSAANDAGLSERQRKTAIAIAGIAAAEPPDRSDAHDACGDELFLPAVSEHGRHWCSSRCRRWES